MESFPKSSAAETAEMYASVEMARWRDGESRNGLDDVVVEEPLEIRLNDVPLAVTMRTPGQDESLAAGFLVTEGILQSPADLYDITRCGDSGGKLNYVTVYADPERARPPETSGRQRYASSSCGLCGRAAIEEVCRSLPPVDSTLTLSAAVLCGMPDRLRRDQEVFHRTGGLHAAGLFNPLGELSFLEEDIGRHNAVDKVVGRAFLHGGWPLGDTVLTVSGRAGFEIVQKALAARIPAVCSVSAPSLLAVELARESGMILAGFVRGANLNVYAGQDRVSE